MKLLGRDPGTLPVDTIALSIVRRWARELAPITVGIEVDLMVAQTLLGELIYFRRRLACSDIPDHQLGKIGMACVAIGRHLDAIQNRLGGTARSKGRQIENFETALRRISKRHDRERAKEGA